jgi:hypothetical protein
LRYRVAGSLGLGAGRATVAASRGAATNYPPGLRQLFPARGFNPCKTCAMIQGINNKRNGKEPTCLTYLPTQ